MSNESEYVLGTDAAELERLGFQHRLWSAQAFALWEQAGLATAQRVLDVGAGPGYASEDLARIVGPRGSVLAVDASQRFLDALARRQPAGVTTRCMDVQALDLPAASFDFAYARWVLCFVPDPEAVVRGVARALAPGGRFAIQDYYRYLALALAPPSATLARVVDAVAASWRAHGGDPEIGLRLPLLLERHGLRVERVAPLVRCTRPGQALWEWPGTFFRTFTPKLVETGYLTRAEHEAFHREWDERTRRGDSVFVSPPMLDIVAVKA